MVCATWPAKNDLDGTTVRRCILQELKDNGSFYKDMYKHVLTCSKDSIKGIENSLKKIDEQIQDIIKQDEKLSKAVMFATSVYGVGITTAVSIIVYTNEFKHIKSGKQLACYAGVIPLYLPSWLRYTRQKQG